MSDPKPPQAFETFIDSLAEGYADMDAGNVQALLDAGDKFVTERVKLFNKWNQIRKKWPATDREYARLAFLAAWRAATAAAYEECATIAEDAHNPPPPAGNDRRWRVAHEIAAAIRERAARLNDQTKTGEKA